jgi:hypothetical protein
MLSDDMRFPFRACVALDYLKITSVIRKKLRLQSFGSFNSRFS